MSEPLPVGVVIPGYNVEPYLARALDSALGQTRPPAEIIFVDDGSTDGTAAIGRDYAARYPGTVRYIHQSNGGVANARNHGIREARYEWLAFLDADDWWKPEKLARQFEVLNADPAIDLVYTSLEIHHDDGRVETFITFVETDLWPRLRWMNCITPSSVVMRRSLMLEAGGFDERLRGTEDWALWAQLVRRARFHRVIEPLTNYREGASGASAHITKMMDNERKALDYSLISDLTGVAAFCWRQRIWCAILFRAAMNARDAKDPREAGFLIRSILEWPSPFFLGLRFRALAMTIRRRVFQ